MNNWAKKFPVLETYKNEVDISYFAEKIRILINELKDKYNYSELNAMLVLKDILANEYFKNKK